MRTPYSIGYALTSVVRGNMTLRHRRPAPPCAFVLTALQKPLVASWPHNQSAQLVLWGACTACARCGCSPPPASQAHHPRCTAAVVTPCAPLPSSCPSSQGQPAGLQELAVINRAGAFMQARSTNQTNVVTALAAQMPATLDLDMSGVNGVNMAGANVSARRHAGLWVATARGNPQRPEPRGDAATNRLVAPWHEAA